MTQHYATIDNSGFLTGFYNDDINGTNIPKDAVAITEVQWRQWMLNTGGQMWNGSDVVPYVPTPPSLPTVWTVPLQTVRERLETLGEWSTAAVALAAAPALMLRVLTTAAGVASDDSDIRALLTGLGIDADVVLALPT